MGLGPLNHLYVETDTGCWEWLGYINADGYGEHRWVYKELVGPIRPCMELDHLCRNRRCCNPAHLEQVTAAENQRRRAAAQTHCKRGHELVEGNLKPHPGRRSCRECQRARDRKYQASKRSSLRVA